VDKEAKPALGPAPNFFALEPGMVVKPLPQQ